MTRASWGSSPPLLQRRLQSLPERVSVTHLIQFEGACKCKPSCPRSNTSTRAHWIASRRSQQRRESLLACTRASSPTPSGASELLLCSYCMIVGRSTSQRSKDLPAEAQLIASRRSQQGTLSQAVCKTCVQ